MTEARRAPAAPRSLRKRLLWGTLVGVGAGLLIAGAALTALFRAHVVNQFQAALSRQLDQLLVELEFDAAGRPLVDTDAMLDPRLQKPYSGLYWQIDVMPDTGAPQIGAARSRSLWDAELDLPAPAATPPGALAQSEGHGPNGETLLILQRVVRSPEQPARRYRLVVAGDLRFNLEATERFGQALGLGLGLLFLLFVATAWAQVSVGLRPLRDLQRALKDVREGRSTRLAGRFPAEVQPLVEDFNQVLAANAAIVERARTQAGNLAHALKTPLAVLENETRQAQDEARAVPAEHVREQIARLRRDVDWHLTRARAAASRGLPGQQTDVALTLAGVLRVLERAFAERALRVGFAAPRPPVLFAGEEQDLQEILGNLLENAFKWARARIDIDLRAEDASLVLEIRDDGPGIADSQLEHARQRGVRLDESTPGSGLGLAIVQDLVQLYGGGLALENRADGTGLCVSVRLPRALRPASRG
ncbi:MAG: HAMP domain-containing sensor histidine kinase [Candidatus Dactylopiibacterium sp.]|nr:HAMP domain-containing sensor histidine kinase [Candidatus Dactylopiibacterium sp.]